MKAKYILLLAALAFSFMACEKQEPFDTQSADDAPLILKPYNESGTGSFTYDLANPDTPLFDSVVVTPSKYTTVNWYIDGVLVYTGVKIEMCFPTGTYNLIIEAVTTQNKRTERKGTVTVHPYDTDPYAAAPASGHHVVPSIEMTLDGENMNMVEELVLSKDINAMDVVCAVVPTAKTAAQLTYTLPETADGEYYLRLKDAAGKLYGSDKISVHNAAVVLSGYEELVPKAEWVLIGAGLQDAAAVTVDDIVIRTLTATTTSITLTAPEIGVGEHTLSITNKDGSNVLFLTSEGLVEQVTTTVSSETDIWTGPVTLDWDAELVKVTKETLADVPVGATIFVYFDIPEAEYHAMRITTPWWGDDPAVDDIVAQMDMSGVEGPFAFTYDERRKALVDERGAMSVVGFGVTVSKITYK